MGKGDRRSRRGKIFRGTFGKSRKHSIATPVPAKAAAAVASAPTEEQQETPKKKRVPKKKVE